MRFARDILAFVRKRSAAVIGGKMAQTGLAPHDWENQL
jgi:hypothetical protein